MKKRNEKKNNRLSSTRSEERSYMKQCMRVERGSVSADILKYEAVTFLLNMLDQARLSTCPLL